MEKWPQQLLNLNQADSLTIGQILCVHVEIVELFFYLCDMCAAQ